MSRNLQRNGTAQPITIIGSHYAFFSAIVIGLVIPFRKFPLMGRQPKVD